VMAAENKSYFSWLVCFCLKLIISFNLSPSIS
jgi:hypothetical protein